MLGVLGVFVTDVENRGVTIASGVLAGAVIAVRPVLLGRPVLPALEEGLLAAVVAVAACLELADAALLVVVTVTLDDTELLDGLLCGRDILVGALMPADVTVPDAELVMDEAIIVGCGLLAELLCAVEAAGIPRDMDEDDSNDETVG